MKNSKRVMRRMILSSLYDFLQQQYSITYPRDEFIAGRLSVHDLDALLAFKSDSRLDELRSALDRLDDGTFGFCLRCKGRISEALLMSDPAHRICALCEETIRHLTHSGFPSHATL